MITLFQGLVGFLKLATSGMSLYEILMSPLCVCNWKGLLIINIKLRSWLLFLHDMSISENMTSTLVKNLSFWGVFWGLFCQLLYLWDTKKVDCPVSNRETRRRRYIRNSKHYSPALLQLCSHSFLSTGRLRVTERILASTVELNMFDVEWKTSSQKRSTCCM